MSWVLPHHYIIWENEVSITFLYGIHTCYNENKQKNVIDIKLERLWVMITDHIYDFSPKCIATATGETALSMNKNESWLRSDFLC